jgi:hypothetical protein
VAFAVHTRGHIDFWDAGTFLQIGEYATDGEAHELFVDDTGKYLLAAFEDELRVYAAEGNPDIDDADGDGVSDGADNCPDDANADQIDGDGDRLGDVCDPFPADADNLGACLAAHPDDDFDGVLDPFDRCPATAFGIEIDAHGCSWERFCGLFDTERRLCRHADWHNDEPRRPRDCRWSRVDNLCVPRDDL